MIQKDSVSNVTFALDSSYSMRKKDPRLRRFNSALDITAEILDLLLVSERDCNVSALACNNSFSDGMIPRALDGSFAHLLRSRFLQTRLMGRTSLGFVVDEAATLGGNQHHGDILLFTDGIQNAGDDPIVAAQRAAKRGIRIHPVSVGSGKEGHGILDIMACETGGVFAHLGATNFNSRLLEMLGLDDCGINPAALDAVMRGNVGAVRAAKSVTAIEGEKSISVDGFHMSGVECPVCSEDFEVPESWVDVTCPHCKSALVLRQIDESIEVGENTCSFCKTGFRVRDHGVPMPCPSCGKSLDLSESDIQ